MFGTLPLDDAMTCNPEARFGVTGDVKCNALLCLCDRYGAAWLDVVK